MALQLPPKSASAVFEGPRQGPDPVTPGKDGGDGTMEWYPKTRPSSSRRNAVLLTVAVAVVAMGTLTVGFAILQETRLQRQELMMLKNRILVLENQLHLKSVEEGGTQGHTPPDPSSEFLQSVTRFPGLAPQANQTREAGRDYDLSRYKRNAHKRGKKDKGKKKKNKEKKNNGKKNQRNRCRNCDVVERMIDCKLQSVRLLHAATRLAGLEQNQEPLDDDTFQWTGPDESYFEHSFELIRNYRNYVTGIKVYKRGVYHIYSQVALRGLYYPPDTRERVEQLQCGHVTVVQRGPTEIILMKSLTAQIQSVPSPATEDGELYPIDTALHVGDFILNEGDTVVVKRPRNCRNVRYHADPHFTYFGVNKLHDLSSSAVDCSL